MNSYRETRDPKLIQFLEITFWPLLRHCHRIEVRGLENVPKKGPMLIVANHNSGALLESHSSLFLIQPLVPNSLLFGFTHPSIFKIPLIGHYFVKIGAVPADLKTAESILSSGDSLMIFPGGNKQALRPIYKYKENNFRQSHGWAKIAIQHNVEILPITFKGTHFLNPIFYSSETLSKILILPRLLGLKSTSISLGQIIISFLVFKIMRSVLPLPLNIFFAYLVFILTPLLICIPWKVRITIHKPKAPGTNQHELEDHIAEIMNNIYS